MTNEGIQKKFGSKELYRNSNENLYNLKYENKYGRVQDDISMKKIKKLAEAVTKYKRAHFNKLKAT